MENQNFTPETAAKALDVTIENIALPRKDHAFLAVALKYLLDKAIQADTLSKQFAEAQAKIEELEKGKK